jgi:hypothetical protein
MSCRAHRCAGARVRAGRRARAPPSTAAASPRATARSADRPVGTAGGRRAHRPADPSRAPACIGNPRYLGEESARGRACRWRGGRSRGTGGGRGRRLITRADSVPLGSWEDSARVSAPRSKSDSRPQMLLPSTPLSDWTEEWPLCHGSWTITLAA